MKSLNTTQTEQFTIIIENCRNKGKTATLNTLIYITVHIPGFVQALH